MRRILALILLCTSVGLIASLAVCTTQVAGGSETEAKVLGKVYYSDSTPAAGAEVYLLSPDSGIIGSVPATVTDNGGNFELTLESDDGPYLLKVIGQRDTVAEEAYVAVDIASQETVELGAIYLKSNGVLKGSVVNFASYPGAAYEAVLRCRGFTVSTTAVDEQGSFVISVAEGDYEVYLRSLAPQYMHFINNQTIGITSGDTFYLSIANLPVRDTVRTLPGYIADSAVVRALLDTLDLREIPVDSVAVIAQSGRVRWLKLRNYGIGWLPGLVGDLPALAILDISYNNLTSLPGEVGNCAILRELYVNRNQLVALPSEIGMLDSLTILDVSDNQLTVLPPELCGIAGLQKLFACNNKLAGLPAGIGSLPALRELNLRMNRIAALPAELGNCAQLEGLNVQKNLLDALPEEVGRCVKMTNLWAEGNYLSVLPESFGSLTAMVGLWVDDNELAYLPSTIGQMRSLRYLYASGNQLTSLPEGITDLLNLARLNVSNNQLTNLPDGLPAMQAWDSIWVGGNYLCSLSTELETWLDSRSEGWKLTQACGASCPDCGIIVQTPNGGEVFSPGQVMTIKWRIASSSIPSVYIYLDLDQLNLSFNPIEGPIYSVDGSGWGQCFFTVPDSLGGKSTLSSSCRIRIASYSQLSVKDESDGDFSIVPWSENPGLRLVSPAGGDSVAVGSQVSIRWEALDPAVYMVSCSLSVDNGGTWFPIPEAQEISRGSSAWQNVRWTVPATLGGTSLRSDACRIKISDYVGCGIPGGTCRFDIGDSAFTIY